MENENNKSKSIFMEILKVVIILLAILGALYIGRITAPIATYDIVYNTTISDDACAIGDITVLTPGIIIECCVFPDMTNSDYTECKFIPPTVTASVVMRNEQ